ncbi:MAG: ribonuclease III [Bacillota bacterium]
MHYMNESRNLLLKELEEKFNYHFQNIKILNESLTHSSYANENKKRKIKYNERLEFLGDSVLSIVISDYIYNHLNTSQEGELTKIRASIVCEPSLAACATRLSLGKYILLGKGEEITGGRERVSILADTFEAIIGALYLDGGLVEARKFILNSLRSTIEDAIHGKIFQDYKTSLQELVQSENGERISYEVINEEGPDHNKVFHVQVKVGEQILGKGSGKSKKEAEQHAAKEALLEVMT